MWIMLNSLKLILNIEQWQFKVKSIGREVKRLKLRFIFIFLVKKVDKTSDEVR